MKEHVDVIIKGMQYPGICRIEEGKHIICYEAEVDEEGSKVAYEIRVGEGELVISQQGAIQATMTYVLDGSAHECIYKTAYGDIPMWIYTHMLEIQKNEEDILISISYSLLQDDTIESNSDKNDIYIVIKSAAT